MGNLFGASKNADDEEEADDERLRRWRPKGGANQHALLRRRGAEASGSSGSEDGGSDGASVASSDRKEASDDEKEEAAGDEEHRSAGSGDDDEDSTDDELEEHARRELEKKQKKVVVRMEFEPLLSLHEPLAKELEAPAELLGQAGRKRKVERAERLAIEDTMSRYRTRATAAAEWMTDMGLEECSLADLAQALGEDQDELRYSLVQSRRYTVDHEGLVQKTIVQKILDVMESDIETLQEVLEKSGIDEESLRLAVADSRGELRLKVANGIELVEHVDQEAEQRLQRAMEKEERLREKEERRKAKARNFKKKRKDQADEEEDSSSSSDEEGDAGGGVAHVNKEADRRAVEFRRLQVQRKIEDFLRTYTRGQHLTKINDKGRRFHRRVYVDTTRKALVIQGASGPKFFPFASMKEVDIETRTTKEGKVETLVICAIEKRGRIVKELHLAFPDQARANTFVNCVTLFSLALRSQAGK